MHSGTRSLVVALIFVLSGWSGRAGDGNLATNAPARRDRGYTYIHNEVPEVPWSIHVFKLERSHHELEFSTTLGNSNVLGMSTVPEQLKSLSGERDQPVAAINGDFYNNNDPSYPGDPRDVQIHHGELVSAPSGHACFWIDAYGNPQTTNVVSRFRAIWPDGTTNAFGLNEPRGDAAAVLYTAAIGPSTRTRGGTEIVLEDGHEGDWLPLRAGHVYRARVRAIQTGGNLPLGGDTMILSLGPELAAHLPPLKPGETVQILTETLPTLAGVTTAIGGGPTLVRAGHAKEWSGLQMRHPRAALGWNKEHFFLVEVDGRQSKLSLGMTFPELANYMLKLGCDEALNLDGGGSATLWVMGNVMNSPSEGHERPGANSLVVVRRRGSPD